MNHHPVSFRVIAKTETEAEIRALDIASQWFGEQLRDFIVLEWTARAHIEKIDGTVLTFEADVEARVAPGRVTPGRPNMN